ncbi:MAG: hypothetical protein LBJ98_03140 [Endomicrobium sp.]|jgi:hypothetical protein|nr:hypothetical protein [Endomicrobium sp.]MDR2644864.1 hypothetical protein [Endomicrobium sp.]
MSVGIGNSQPYDPKFEADAEEHQKIVDIARGWAQGIIYERGHIDENEWEEERSKIFFDCYHKVASLVYRNG